MDQQRVEAVLRARAALEAKDTFTAIQAQMKEDELKTPTPAETVDSLMGTSSVKREARRRQRQARSERKRAAAAITEMNAGHGTVAETVVGDEDEIKLNNELEIDGEVSHSKIDQEHDLGEIEDDLLSSSSEEEEFWDLRRPMLLPASRTRISMPNLG